MRNLLNLGIILCCLTFSSCKSQEAITINYEARTRGYHQLLTLNNNLLDIIENGDKKSIELTKNQFNVIEKLLSEINFLEIKNNTSTDNFAVDASMPVTMSIFYKEKEHKFNFDSSNLPKEIKKLMLKLEEFSKE